MKAYTAEETNNKRTEVSVDSKKRNFKSKIWNKALPLGYNKKHDSWLEKIPKSESIIKECHNHFVLTKNVASVRRHINRKYSQLSPKPLSSYQIKRILSDPVYIGKPEHMGVVVHDPSLAFVDEKMFAKCQKILEKKLSRHKPNRLDPIKELVTKYGISALGFIDNLEYHHKSCGGLVVKNGTRIVELVRRQTFVCKKCGEQFWVPSNSQLNKIQTSTAGISIHPLAYCSPSSERLKENKRLSQTQKGRNTKYKQVAL